MGQESVAQSLSKAISGGRIGHAFLFVGSRGTGKTSTARILAKALNCAKGPTPSPCGACDSCRAIEEGSDVDVLEIDAASNNSVENVRELRERVGFAPMRGRYRITILDEVHMLSAGAFNALLKTLEEPPAHAKFIFATTAPEKIPDTIRSRCQVYEFRRIETGAIVKRLVQICEKEKIRASEEVLSSIAKNARGGMRDSLSMLDQLVAFAGNEATVESLARLSGTASREAVAGLASAILEGNRPEILRRVADHIGRGGEPLELLDQLLEHARGVLAVALCGRDFDGIEEPPEAREALAALAAAAGPDRIEAILRYLVSARERARHAGPLARAAIESALLAASRSGEISTIPDLLQRLEQLERRLATGAPRTVAPVPASAAPMGAPAPAPVSAAPGRALQAPALAGAATLLDALAQRNSYGRLLKDKAKETTFDAGLLRVVLAGLDATQRAVAADAGNRSAAERFLADRSPGLRLSVEIVESAGSVVPASPRTTPAAPSAPRTSAPPPAPARPSPPAQLPLEGTPSPGVARATELVRGRVVGRTAPDKAKTKPNDPGQGEP